MTSCVAKGLGNAIFLSGIRYHLEAEGRVFGQSMECMFGKEGVALQFQKGISIAWLCARFCFTSM